METLIISSSERLGRKAATLLNLQDAKILSDDPLKLKGYRTNNLIVDLNCYLKHPVTIQKLLVNPRSLTLFI